MEDHDYCHAQSEHVHEIGGGLEDDGVCKLDAPSVAIWLNACVAVDAVAGAHQRAQRKSILLTYRGEVSKSHNRRTSATDGLNTLGSLGQEAGDCDRPSARVKEVKEGRVIGSERTGDD